MLEVALVAGTFVLATVATIILFRLRRRSRRARAVIGSDCRGQLNQALASAHTVERTHLEAPPRVYRIDVHDAPSTAEGASEDGTPNQTQPEIVPVIRVELGMTEPPSMDLAFEYVGSILEAVHPLLESTAVDPTGDTDAVWTDRIRHYDVQFVFGPDGFLVSRLCQRVSVPLEIAERFCTEDSFRTRDLHKAIENGDDGGEAEAPVLWGSC